MTSVDSQTILSRLPSLAAMISSAHSSPIFFRMESGPSGKQLGGVGLFGSACLRVARVSDRRCRISWVLI